MKIGRKGINPRFKVFSPVDLFRTNIGVLLSHTKPFHMGDVKETQSALTTAITTEYMHFRKRLFDEYEPKTKVNKLKCLQFNDSVSALRTSMIKFINKAKGITK